MPIQVSCGSCGASFAARDELAGKRVRCPKCRQPISIPAPASGGLDDLLDEIGLGASTTPGGRRCPSCGASMAPQAMICVNCSYNVQTGRRMVAAGEDPLAASAIDQTAETLRKAEEDLRKSPMQQTEGGYGEGGMAYLIAVGALLIAAAVIGGGILFVHEMTEGKDAFKGASDGAKWFALIFALASWGEIIYWTFRQYGSLHGGLSIIPPYAIIFAIIKSPNFVRPLFMYLMAMNLQILSGVLLMVGVLVDAGAAISMYFYVTLVGMQVAALNLLWWGTVRITGTAYEEEIGGITHGTFSLLVPIYAFAYGFYRRKQPYTRFAAFGVGGMALLVGAHIGAIAVIAAAKNVTN